MIQLQLQRSFQQLELNHNYHWSGYSIVHLRCRDIRRHQQSVFQGLMYSNQEFHQQIQIVLHQASSRNLYQLHHLFFEIDHF